MEEFGFSAKQVPSRADRLPSELRDFPSQIWEADADPYSQRREPSWARIVASFTGEITPFSVMIASIRFAYVTSNAGL